MSGLELCGNKAMDRARKLEPLAKLEPLSPRRPSMMDPAFMKDAIPLVPAGARPSKGPCVCSGDADHGGMRWRKLASDAERQAMRFFVECMLPPQLQPKGELGVGDEAARFCDRPACVFAAFSAWWRDCGRAEFLGPDDGGALGAYDSGWADEAPEETKASTFGRTAAMVADRYVNDGGQRGSLVAQIARGGHGRYLVVHVVGAAKREGQTPEETARVFAPLIDAAKRRGFDGAALALVGPGTPEALHGTLHEEDSLAIAYAKTLYPDFLEAAAPRFKGPDVVFAFHAALYGHAQWKRTIARLLYTPAVLAITAYSLHEAALDFETLQDIALDTGNGNVTALVPAKPNPFGATSARTEGRAPNGLWMDDNLAITVVQGAAPDI